MIMCVQKLIERLRQKEAMSARDILFAAPPHEVLVPEVWQSHRTTPLNPFGVKDIREDAFASAMRQILETASPETRTVYELVASKEDNWIIRYLLWHAIEDDRQPRLGQNCPARRTMTGFPCAVETGDSNIKIEEGPPRKRSRHCSYDPVREQ